MYSIIFTECLKSQRTLQTIPLYVDDTEYFIHPVTVLLLMVMMMMMMMMMMVLVAVVFCMCSPSYNRPG